MFGIFSAIKGLSIFSNIGGLLGAWWIKPLMYLLIAAALFGSGYIKGKQHEQDKQNDALVEFYDKQLEAAAKKAKIENEAAIKAQKELADIRKEADAQRAKVRALTANKPVYQNKMSPEVKALINEGLKAENKK